MIWALVEGRLVWREATAPVRSATWETREGEGAAMESSESTQRSAARSESIPCGEVLAGWRLEGEKALAVCFPLALEEVGLAKENTGANGFGGIWDGRGGGGAHWSGLS